MTRPGGVSSKIERDGLAKIASDNILAGKPDKDVAGMLGVGVGVVGRFKKKMARNAAVVLQDQYTTVEKYTGEKFLDTVKHIQRNVNELYEKRGEWTDSPELFLKLVEETRHWIELSAKMMGELKSVQNQVNTQVNVFSSPEVFDKFEGYLATLHREGRIQVIDVELKKRCGL